MGRDAFVKEKETEKLFQKKAQDETILSDFVQRKQQAQALMRAEGDFLRSQKACEQLDTQAGWEAPVVSWFWPQVELTVTDEQEETQSAEEDEEIEVRIVCKPEYSVTPLRSTPLGPNVLSFSEVSLTQGL